MVNIFNFGFIWVYIHDDPFWGVNSPGCHYMRFSVPKIIENLKVNQVRPLLWQGSRQLLMIHNLYVWDWLRDGIFPGSRIPIPGIGFFFYFGLDRKIPKSRDRDRDLKIPKKSGRSGWGFENPEKFPRAKSRKSRKSGSWFENPENPGYRDLVLKIPKKSQLKSWSVYNSKELLMSKIWSKIFEIFNGNLRYL